MLIHIRDNVVSIINEFVINIKVFLFIAKYLFYEAL